jgi:endonuclease/exonuclease/phosphatase family metal-dependent hydrolase
MRRTSCLRACTTPLMFWLLACGSEAPSGAEVAAGDPTAAEPPPAAASPAPAPSAPAEQPAPPAKPGPLSFVAVTFNTGISEGSHHDTPPDDGFGKDESKINADHYGNGLAWNAAIDQTRAFFQSVSADVVTFQEIFHPGDCASIPASAKTGFVCETWKPGDPTVAQSLLGAGYQVACNLGKPDKCAAVKTSFGAFRGCSSSLCLDGLAGATVPGCGKGARIGRGVIDLAQGGTLTLVNVHGSSGFGAEEQECRKKQLDQVFVDLDGAPAANGTSRNLVMGDFNTDPGRLTGFDPSAAALAGFAGPGKKFQFITEVGPNVEPTYRASFLSFLPLGVNIDHVLSDTLKGKCWTAGVTPGHAPVASMIYFDHNAEVCTLTE